MSIFKRVEEDVLDLAHKVAAESLDLFHSAIDGLQEANEHLQVVVEKAEADIAAAEQRLATAKDAALRNDSVIAKIKGLVG